MPRLLFDENVSHRLVERLASVFPSSMHVRETGLRGQSDEAVWSHAAREGLTIVTKDDDFRQLSFLRGAPPKVVWLVIGNASTDVVARMLQDRQRAIETFVADASEALLVLRLPKAERP